MPSPQQIIEAQAEQIDKLRSALAQSTAILRLIIAFKGYPPHGPHAQPAAQAIVDTADTVLAATKP